ncbi:MAG: DNA translocase FtsK [bacterium]
MAKKDNGKAESNNGFFIVTIEKKKKILGIFLTVLALLIFLSIISYSRQDSANMKLGFLDLFKVFSPSPETRERFAEVHNWLGIFGAYISNFFIHSTIGYFSIVFPVIVFIWGWSIVRNQTFKLAVYLSNFLVVVALLASTFFGMLRFTPQPGIFTDVNELSGNVGDFFGTAVGRLLGTLGSSILLITLMFVTFFIAFDLSLSKIIAFLKGTMAEAFEPDENAKTKTKKSGQSKSNENLAKIKDLSKKESKKRFSDLFKSKADANDGAEILKDDDTRIRIIKRDEKEVMPDLSLSKKEKLKQSEKPQEKTDNEGDNEFFIDKEAEAKFPPQWEEEINYNPPGYELLTPPRDEDIKIPEEELKRNAELLKEKLALFDIKIEDISVTPGPVVTMYEIVPEPGVKISRIVSLENDIALALAARGIRIIAPIPGKSAIGVEIPNSEPSLVYARSVIKKIKESKAELPLALGKTIAGDVYITDLATMPHLLIAGSTGSGKSVGINMIITGLLYTKHPSDIKFVIIDPKKIELSFYSRLSKHYLAVSPDLEEEIITTPGNALLALKAVEYEMEKRYDKLAKARVRSIIEYNKMVLDPKRKPKDTEKMIHHKLPYIIIIIDELADLMITAGKEVEEPIARLAQLARAVGIHLILATQRPSVNVITGTIKANFSARIAYQVATKIDSRTILDMNGAEQLLGRGDMLFLPGGMPKPVRIQNAFISTEEIEAITNYIYVQKGFSKRYFLPSLYEKKRDTASNFLSDLDPMFEEAARVIVRHQQGSVSLLQRRLKLGYSRAARIVDQLEQAGVVGSADGSKAREVLIENDEQLDAIIKSL